METFTRRVENCLRKASSGTRPSGAVGIRPRTTLLAKSKNDFLPV